MFARPRRRGLIRHRGRPFDEVFLEQPCIPISIRLTVQLPPM
jgi:hypothetical protein